MTTYVLVIEPDLEQLLHEKKMEEPAKKWRNKWESKPDDFKWLLLGIEIMRKEKYLIIENDPIILVYPPSIYPSAQIAETVALQTTDRVFRFWNYLGPVPCEEDGSPLR